MKIQKVVLLSVLLLIAGVVSAQDYAFKVLASKGNNEVKSGQGWQPLKTGGKLQSGDEVKLSDNAYVGLVHSSGKPVEVKEAGVYKVSALESKVGTGSSVLNKYTDFILSTNTTAAKNRLSATGAVHRGFDNADISLLLPENQYAGVFNNNAVIVWEGSKVAGPYVITLKNMFEDVLTKEEVADTLYEIDLGSDKYANENAILIEVTSKSDPSLTSAQRLIKKLSPSQQEKISAEFQELKPGVAGETALGQLILAGFYEKNHLVIDALYAYQQAIKMEPQVPLFKEAYADFLARNELK